MGCDLSPKKEQCIKEKRKVCSPVEKGNGYFEKFLTDIKYMEVSSVHVIDNPRWYIHKVM